MDWKEKIKRWCSICERSEAEVLRKLSNSGVSHSDASAYLEELKNDSFIDEQRFLSAFIHDHFVLKNWGPRKIYDGLLKKGCNSQQVQRALSSLTTEDIEKALKATISTRYSIYPDEHKNNKTRLVRFLQTRGYALEQILTVLDGFS
jgi:SOS response regulatory protein OraA/RecX